MKKHQTLVLIIAAVLAVLIYSQLTIFVIPPIGALPEGKTIIITRLNKTEFIDSSDGMCDRIQGGVSLLCRGMIMGAVVEKSTVLLRHIAQGYTAYLQVARNMTVKTKERKI